MSPYPSLFLCKVKRPLIIEEVPRWGNSDSPGNRCQELREAIEIHYRRCQSEQVRIGNVELHFFRLGVHDRHNAETELRDVVWTTMVASCRSSAPK